MFETEQPNQNQSSFGPSNQSSTFSQPNQSQNQGAAGVNNQALSGFAAPNSGFGNPGTVPNQPPQNPTWGGTPPSASTGALPWQNNDTQPSQQSVSNPSWNVGHDGTQNNMNRDQYRDSWMSSGVSNNQAMDQWLAQNGGQRLNDSGVVRTPYGEILDMGMAFKTGSGKPAWTDLGMNQMGTSPVGPSVAQQQAGYQQSPGLAGPGGNINPPTPPPGYQQGPQQPILNPTSNYNFGPTQGQNQMDISSLLGGNKMGQQMPSQMPGQQMPGQQMPVQGQSPFGPTNSRTHVMPNPNGQAGLGLSLY